MNTKDILNLIANYKINQAFEVAYAMDAIDSYMLTQLQARFVRNNHEYYTLYIKSDSEYNLACNQIVNGFLELLKTTESINHETVVVQRFHPLHRFPRGPLVKLEKIPKEIIETYAELISYQEAAQIIADSVNYRLEADNDEKVTYLKMIHLPPTATTSAKDFWTVAFRQAALHGPRMLGALLSVVSDELFTKRVKEQRRTLMSYMESMWE